MHGKAFFFMRTRLGVSGDLGRIGVKWKMEAAPSRHRIHFWDSRDPCVFRAVDVDPNRLRLVCMSAAALKGPAVERVLVS